MISLLAAAQPLTETTTAEGIQFWILGTLAVLGALGVVVSTKAVYSAVFLAATMIVLAILYIAQGALFLGVVQIVVYTGAVMMLFLFVVMLVGVTSSDSLVETLRGHRIAAVVTGLGFGILIAGGLGRGTVSTFVGLDSVNSAGNVEGLAELIFVRYVWAFELTGALLITATLGAMVLTHSQDTVQVSNQRDMSMQRFKVGARVTPLPSPGVYARHNAVDTPALLHDGSASELSVSRVFHRTRTPNERLESGDAR